MRLTGVVLALGTLAACGTATAGYDPSNDASDYSHPLGKVDLPAFMGDQYDDNVKLADGREVVVYVQDNIGLFEQHHSPDHEGWSKPHLLFATDQDTCQYPTLKTSGSTVALQHGFDIYCYDGEPPEQSFAAVATGDLTKWDVHLQERSDGYDTIGFADGGDTVTFTSNVPDEKVVWKRGEGIDDPYEAP